MPSNDALIIVSNRGPAEFDRDEQGERIVKKGGGGLVTALSGLASARRVHWIASAMSETDVEVAEEAEGPIEVELGGVHYEVEMVASDPDAYDMFYSVIANPQLWFIQHYLWDLSNAPDIGREEKEAWERGYQVVNEDIAKTVVARIDGQSEPLVMLHDYHLYTAPGLIRAERPDAFLHHFVHIPWPHSDAWRVIPRRWREQIYRGLLA
ncbi:MAG: trehalose-6-phosphate synthase, partial [Solirubrobacterales bacterium]